MVGHVVSRGLVDGRPWESGFLRAGDGVRVLAGSERVPLAEFVMLSSERVSSNLHDVRDSQIHVPFMSTVQTSCGPVLDVAGGTDTC